MDFLTDRPSDKPSNRPTDESMKRYAIDAVVVDRFKAQLTK